MVFNGTKYWYLLVFLRPVLIDILYVIFLNFSISSVGTLLLRDLDENIPSLDDYLILILRFLSESICNFYSYYTSIKEV